MKFLTHFLKSDLLPVMLLDISETAGDQGGRARIEGSFKAAAYMIHYIHEGLGQVFKGFSFCYPVHNVYIHVKGLAEPGSEFLCKASYYIGCSPEGHGLDLIQISHTDDGEAVKNAADELLCGFLVILKNIINQFILSIFIEAGIEEGFVFGSAYFAAHGSLLFVLAVEIAVVPGSDHDGQHTVIQKE